MNMGEVKKTIDNRKGCVQGHRPQDNYFGGLIQKDDCAGDGSQFDVFVFGHVSFSKVVRFRVLRSGLSIKKASNGTKAVLDEMSLVTVGKWGQKP
jgi:hypothetical protein